MESARTGMKRHFILHVGPTNCGKTYQALQRLRTAYKGIYLGPLRLLALEVYEKMRESGVPLYDADGAKSGFMRKTAE